ncbi:protein phosphatase 1 regulatory subunit 32 [Ornithorhynchus anatinus]|uniref:protein phosphatase 1 regulatory subunit 32 n=1 Tax=Ornithorhynchus anatinus TaxID=9258 RepID=UPI0010A8D448|nr:protein phosphatase 1 regulatory subunit 32 [Ornithorhynchus anatinus]
MTGKLPLGTVSPYIKISSGGCTDPLKFYATSYCTAYSREGFKPQKGHHSGTGYQTNCRPIVSYKPSLDRVDNPVMGELLKDNYQTVTNQHFRSHELPDGKYPLPWSVHQPGSGYMREKPLTCPTTKEVKKVHFNTQEHGPEAITGLEPKAVPVLHQSLQKGSSDQENARHGPRFMSTEYGSKFRFDVPGQPDFLQRKTIGAKEETGFTEDSHKNPIVFQPPSQALPGDPVLAPGVSITKTDYVPSVPPRGDEALPVLARNSERETAFSREKDTSLNPAAPPLGMSPLLHPSTVDSSSMSHRQFQGLQHPPQTTTGLLGRVSVGCKKPSGFSINNPTYVRTSCDPDMANHYLTSYNQKFFENIPKGLDREGWTRGGIQPQQPGGFGANQLPTSLGSSPNPTETLRSVHPQVGRALTTKDPFFSDTPHNDRFLTFHHPS